MANLAELDLALSQPCRRCAQLLHGRVKFCPYCGSENDAPPWGHEAANAAFGPGRAAPDDRAEPEVPLAPEAPAMPRRDVEEKTELPAVLDARGDAGEDGALDIAHIVPAAFEWPDDLPATVTTVEPRALAPRRGPLLKYAAIGAVMIATVLALVLGYVRSNQENEAARSRALTAQLAQAQSALARGDFIATERELAVLAAAYPGHPGVRELSDALDRRMQEQLARQEELRQATLKATRSLALGAPAPSVAKAPPAAQAPVAVAPAPPVAVQEPEKSECNAALAALALCSAGSGR
ncbi:hypothetical protein [Variovorax guangxiensis]|uniref:hypothetical protein n=1 Tax=Variovorax guangxiensis TaxID=1775474 RepID=UPI00285507D6|nr:hypothetical protein [Variovorax guangxiensis]MDR6857283.1 hypothetical protein [Variovorax guangxiensis]